ncbi:hypothetical protein [Arthrobacter sp. NicSoilB8]|uniref:hypothetical protein n=1 Tax=Arthrobacter sp. NicSoilB8 TaxID=2830998 RepID=UPI001CC62429|nr:hypothetical protein [Arthrobacter sp. NicSoilB8]BCW72163.1 hypothetical protein NicSoilB8_32070 [Arthrobacter sp. NicSoilB8]
MESCAECRARQQRERQYLEKLRGAAVPEASEDLTARLLARTEQLAAERGDAERRDAERRDAERRDVPRDRAQGESVPGEAEAAAPDLAGTGRPLAGWPAVASRPRGGLRGGARLPVLAAGGAVAALALMSGTAYFMGGDAPISADGAEASALARTDTAGPPAAAEPLGAGELLGADGSGDAGAPGVGFGPDGEPDFTPAGALSAGQLAALRAQGWTCPELRDLGFHLIWARAGVMSGDKVLELRLTDGRHFATVLEQHVAPPHAPGTPPAADRTDASPVNVLTGHAAFDDGFSRTTAGLPSSGAKPGDGELWVNPAPPYRAIYRTASATYTYISDLPVDQADDGAAALARVSSAPPGPASRDGIPERIERGLSRILEHLAP